MEDKAKIDWKEIHKKELVDFVSLFYRTSWAWRSQAYHKKWDQYERNYRNIYDPEIKNKKKPWQVTMFMPATVTNVEVISSALTKISSSTKHPLAVEPRESGDELQAELNNDILDYFVEKGDYIVNRYQAQKEACIFGSGFLKLFWENKTMKRRVKEPVVAGFKEALMKMVMPGTVIGEKEVVKDVVVKSGVKYQWVHIRDIFLEPNATDGQRLIHRDKITYGELKRLADAGLFDKKSVDELWMVREPDNFETDTAVIKYEQNQTDPKLARPSFEKKHTVWEYWGPLPRKWIDFEMPENTGSEKQAANEITQGKAMIASGSYFLGSEENKNYSMEPDFIQFDYIWTGQTYGLGVAEIMAGLQEELNEVRNLRIDNVTLLMNKIFLCIEKYVVNMDEVQASPGALLRLKGSDIDDVRKVFSELPISDVPLSAFRETAELERQIQETTAANRVTLGTSGMVRDTNQTLGGMELLKQAAFDRFTVYAFIMGRKVDIRATKITLGLIYQNITDEMVNKILGMEPIEYLPGQFAPRWQLWKRQNPDEIDVCYDFVPVDVFGMENKMQKAQSLASYGQLAMSILPIADPKPFLKRLGRLNGLETNEIDEILSGVADQGAIPTPMGMGGGIPSISRPTKQTATETSPMPSPTASPLG